METGRKLCEMHCTYFPPHLIHVTTFTVLNADVPNCYTTLKAVVCNKLSTDLLSTNKQKCGLFTRIISWKI